MILSVVIGAIGTGLLSTIGLNTNTVRWAAYMVITGIGIGVGVQLPYTAVQVVMRYLAPSVIDRSPMLTCMPAKQMRRLLMVGLFLILWVSLTDQILLNSYNRVLLSAWGVNPVEKPCFT